VKVCVNGKAQDVGERCNVQGLLDALACRGRIAVEVNGEIVPRSQYGERTLSEGDRVEVVRAIGGG
jgi:sulfur carrier protein